MILYRLFIFCVQGEGARSLINSKRYCVVIEVLENITVENVALVTQELPMSNMADMKLTTLCFSPKHDCENDLREINGQNVF